MGLDMYLSKRSYVKNWEHMTPEERHEINITKHGKPTHIKPERVSYITEEVAYWRKANAIHKWFVDNVQGGKDDCGDYYVSRKQLEDLRNTCELVVRSSKLVDGKVKNGARLTEHGWEEIIEDGKVIDEPLSAHALLPTQDGFFFGGTDYDEYYFQDVKDTMEMLTKLLAEEDRGEFYYHSSW